MIKNVYPRPANFLKEPVPICYGEKQQLTAVDGYQRYNWSTGSNANTIDVNMPESYSPEVTDRNGCIGKDTAAVLSKAGCATEIYIPTAFTRNGDGKNDLIMPVAYGLVEQYQIEIYNRWGERIFNSSAPGKGWDGRIGEQRQDSGVYVWKCRYQLMGGKVKSESGTVMLLR